MCTGQSFSERSACSRGLAKDRDVWRAHIVEKTSDPYKHGQTTFFVALPCYVWMTKLEERGRKTRERERERLLFMIHVYFFSEKELV